MILNFIQEVCSTNDILVELRAVPQIGAWRSMKGHFFLWTTFKKLLHLQNWVDASFHFNVDRNLSQIQNMTFSTTSATCKSFKCLVTLNASFIDCQILFRSEAVGQYVLSVDSINSWYHDEWHDIYDVDIRLEVDNAYVVCRKTGFCSCYHRQ